MRIAQVSPLWERVPPRTYGGTERVVYLLTEELVRRGHEVTLFATRDSETSARLVSVCDSPLRLQDVRDSACVDLVQTGTVFDRAAEFDLIHNHLGFGPVVCAALVETPTVTTLHGNFTPDLKLFYKHYGRHPLVSISDAQRRAMPELNYVATIYHGLDIEKFPFEPEPEMREPYLAFLGRISPEKGVHLAIALAERTGWRLKLAGKIDLYDQAYWEQQIAPRVDGRRIEYLGEMDDVEKVQLLSRATATLCLIQWPEPFGLVMIESLACGTPVVAIRNGSVPEVITEGKTGIICDDVEGVIGAVTPAGARSDSPVQRLSRRVCRLEVEQRFSAGRMTDDYEKVYAQLVGAKHGSSLSARPEQEKSSRMSARAAWG